MGKSLKILYLTYHTIVRHSGISKKIIAQTEGMRACGAEVDLCFLDRNENGEKCRVCNGKTIRKFGSGLRAKLLKRISYSDITEYAASTHTDILYIRYDINADPFTVFFIRSVKKLGIKTVVEIPTWPYDREFRGQGLMMNLQLLVDRMFRRMFFSHCDLIVLTSRSQPIFSRPTLCISNGVDIDSKKLAPAIGEVTGLRMLSVANIHLWHGLDRLIRAMGEQSGVKAELHIVGDGQASILEEYRAMIERYSLSDRVKILGPMFGEDLDREFEWCNMAVGSLGRHRSGNNRLTSLKNREYAARGRAFFYSEEDEDFDSRPYIYKVSADEGDIELSSVLSFLKSQTLSPAEIRESIRGLGWKEQMQKVLNRISEL